MPLLFLAIGGLILLVGLSALIRLGDPALLKKTGFALFCLALTIALMLLAATGRLPWAVGIVIALLPFADIMRRKSRFFGEKKQPHGKTADGNSRLSPADAREILGVTENASPEEIKQAYRDLIRKVHPDQSGSDWLAVKINQAREILLTDAKNKR